MITNSGTANGTAVTVHDIWGNVIAELNASGQTVREYIWLPETEIAPTRQARTQVDRPIAIIAGVNTASPVTLFVHADHLHRPVRMTNSAKAALWTAIWTPWGHRTASPAQRRSIHASRAMVPARSGPQLQTGTGITIRHWGGIHSRTLGFVDGPSVYAYAGSRPLQNVDVIGLFQMCHRPINNAVIAWLGYRHCYLQFDDGTTLSFDPNGVHPNPRPDHPDRQCTPDDQKYKDDCLRREMRRCTAYRVRGNNCCNCVAAALAACEAAVPRRASRTMEPSISIMIKANSLGIGAIIVLIWISTLEIIAYCQGDYILNRSLYSVLLVLPITAAFCVSYFSPENGVVRALLLVPLITFIALLMHLLGRMLGTTTDLPGILGLQVTLFGNLLVGIATTLSGVGLASLIKILQR